MERLPIYDAVLGDNDEIQLISFVDSPAIQQDFVYFNEEISQFVDQEKMMIVSPVMIPDKLIYRSNKSLGDFYTKFSKETIEKIVYQYSKDENQNKTNLNHKTKIDGVVMLESWISEFEDDKSKHYGFNLPIGTWFVKYKVDNQELWDKIKAGQINGLSIEGYLSYSKEEFKETYKELSIQDELLMIFNKEKLVAVPQAGESRDEFLSRCIPIEIRKGHPQDQAIAICEVTYTNK